MARSIREDGQPTPQQVVKDAFANIPSHELAEVASAQTQEDDEVILNEALSSLEQLGTETFDDEKLTDLAGKLSKTISLAVLKEGPYDDISKIPELYTPKLERMIRHSSTADDNHVWRLVSPVLGVLEVRTGPFYDDVVEQTYKPELKVTLPKNESPILNNNEALAKAVGIIADVFPKNHELTKNLNFLVGN